MGIARHLINITALFFLLTAPALAEDFAFKGRYVFAFSGVPIGTMDIALEQNAHRYSAKSDIALTGLAKLFVPHESRTVSSGSGKHFMYDDVDYESRYSTKNKPKYVRIEREKGRIVKEKVEPADNRATRPAVPTADKNKALDPLYVALALRTKLAASKAGEAFALTYYDGRRLTRVNFTVVGDKTIRIRGQKTATTRVTATRTLLAGYTEKEKARIAEGDTTLNIYFSRDERRIPLLLSAPTGFGEVTAMLVE